MYEMVAKYSVADVLAKCERAEIPFSPIARPEDLFKIPQLNQGNSLIEVTLPNGDKTKLTRLPFVLEEQELDVSATLSIIGQHTEEILSVLGY